MLTTAETTDRLKAILADHLPAPRLMCWTRIDAATDADRFRVIWENTSCHALDRARFNVHTVEFTDTASIVIWGHYDLTFDRADHVLVHGR